MLLSGRGRDDVEASEHAVRDSGEAWTILRTAWLHQNFSEGILAPAVRAGLVALPANDVPEPFIDAADVADVACAALTEDGHNGREYELTGPELLTFTDVTAAISQAIGREVAYRSVSPQRFTTELTRQAIPRPEAALLATVFTTVLGGRNAHLTTDVHQILGRQPCSFGDYVRTTAATGVWNPAASPAALRVRGRRPDARPLGRQHPTRTAATELGPRDQTPHPHPRPPPLHLAGRGRPAVRCSGYRCGPPR